MSDQDGPPVDEDQDEPAAASAAATVHGTTPLPSSVTWHRATDEKSVDTITWVEVDRYFRTEGWKGTEGWGPTLVEESRKMSGILNVELAKTEAISVAKGYTKPGQLFAEARVYVDNLAGDVHPLYALYAFVKMKREELGLGHLDHTADPIKVNPTVRDFIWNLHYAGSERRFVVAKLDEPKVTLVDIMAILRKQCIEYDMDQFLCFAASPESVAHRTGKSVLMHEALALGDPSFDMRFDVTYKHDLARLRRHVAEARARKVAPGSARGIDELDNAAYKRDWNTPFVKGFISAIKMVPEFNLIWGGAQSSIYQGDEYLRDFRVGVLFQVYADIQPDGSIKRGMFEVFRKAGPQFNVPEKGLWGLKLVPRRLAFPDMPPGPMRLMRECRRYTDAHLPAREKIFAMKGDELDELTSPLDDKLEDDPEWGLDLIESEDAPAGVDPALVPTALMRGYLSLPSPAGGELARSGVERERVDVRPAGNGE